jgi:hypothetical protein
MLESLRRRRRLIIATSVILIAGPLTFLGAHHMTSGSAQSADGKRLVAQPQGAGTSGGGVRVDTTWLLVPLGVMGLVMLIPVGLLTVLWIRYRRAEAAYTRDRKALGDGDEAP